MSDELIEQLRFTVENGIFEAVEADCAEAVRLTEQRVVERIVAYARGQGGNAFSRDVLYFADKVEQGVWKR